MKIITTIGTSLQTNDPKTDDFRLSDEQLSDEILNEVDFKNLVTNLTNKAIQEGNKASAEIASIEKIDPDGQAEIYLICTETVLSKACGEAFRKFYGDRVKEVKVIKGLKVDNSDEFEQEGIPNLMKKVQTYIGDPVSKEDWHLNISGGYKGLIPIITIMGQLYKLPIHYTYEESEELISIYMQGIGIDWTLLEQYGSFLVSPELASGGNLNSMRELGLIKRDRTELTVLGSILSDYIQNNDHPFSASTIGYMFEYKVWEFLMKNRPDNVTKIIHSLKSDNSDAGNVMEDIDIWMCTGAKSGIAVECKSIAIKSKKIKNAITRHQEIVFEKEYKIEEYWVILYSFDKKDDHKLSLIYNSLNTCDFEYPVKVFFVELPRNSVDGSTNRFSQHEFWRSEIDKMDKFNSKN